MPGKNAGITQINSAGISMARDVEIKIDSNKAIQALISAFSTFISGITGSGDAMGSAASTLTNAIDAIKLDSSPGEKAWQLFCLSFCWSLNEILPTENRSSHSTSDIIARTITAAKPLIGTHGHVPYTFLERPTTLPLYQAIKAEFSRVRGELSYVADENAPAFEARLDAAFNRAVFEAWSRKPEAFASLATALNSPGRIANELSREWDAYRRLLVYDFEARPVFGQEISKIPLAQMYVPLRATWRSPKNPENDGDTESQSRPRDSLDLHVLKLEEELLDWIRQGDSSDSIRLVGGGPGSGKSTSMRALARRLADMPEYNVLFVSLQHISLDGDLRDSINQYFTRRTGGAFTHSPLARSAIEGGPPLVIIFDGLDELSRPGEAANDVASLFASRLNQLLASIRGDAGLTIRAIATGRMPAFQAVRKHTACSGRRCLEVVGFLPIHDAHTESRALAQRDQRGDWWAKYAPLIARPASGPLPQALRDDRLSGITHEPLLCYLLGLSGFITDDWEAAADNRNRIYERLIEAVWVRGWGDGPGTTMRQGPGKSLSKENFFRLMEAIALAAWLGGDTRVASEVGFTEAVNLLHAQTAWSDFQNDSGSDVTNLAMNFYLRGSEVERRGFEFTHKSFGEYLAARALIEIADATSAFADRRVDVAMTDWLKSTKTGIMTDEVLSYLRDEFRLIFKHSESKVFKTLEGLEVVARTVLAEGFPAHGNVSQTWRSSENHQKNSETALWALINAATLAANEHRSEKRLVQVPFPGSNLKNLVTRLSSFSWEGSIITKCLSYIDAPKADIFSLNLVAADMRGARLDDADLCGTHLMRANLSGASLRYARLERANLDLAKFEGADLEGANIFDARITGLGIIEHIEDVQTNERPLLDLVENDALPEKFSKILISYKDDKEDFFRSTRKLKSLLKDKKRQRLRNNSITAAPQG